jgi:hypothetical protein
MALIILIAKNQTGSPVPLTQLLVPDAEIPALGQVTLTTYNTVEQILSDTELLGLIDGDSVYLNVAGVDLTKAQSIAFLDAPTVGKKSNYTSANTPTVNDDAAQGYSVGSLWITTSGIAYLCVDATTGAAVWKFAIANTGVVPIPMQFLADGYFRTATGIDIQESQVAFTASSVVLRREKAGISGTTLIDILLNGTSLWATNPGNRPSISAAAGDGTRVVSGALDTTAIPVGGRLEMVIVTAETGNPQDLVAFLRGA